MNPQVLKELSHLIDARRNLRKAKETSNHPYDDEVIEECLLEIEEILSEHLGDYSVEPGAADHE